MASASAALLSAAGHAHAQAPAPQPAPPAAEATEEDEIVIIAEQADSTRIDRRVYTLRDDPVSQSSTMLDVLARVPSVTVAPSGEIRLLGAEGVQIQVDGQPVPGQSLDAVLRSLTGAEVERIEVITNPSAQYSAQAGGGIINIITRDRFALGLTGAATGGVDSTGGYFANAAPTFTRGPWSFGARANANFNTWEGDAVRTREDFGTGAQSIDLGQWEGETRNGGGGFNINFRPNERRRASLYMHRFGWESGGDSGITRTTNGVAQYAQDTRTDNSGAGTRLGFNFQQNGDTAGELVRLNAFVGNFENESSAAIDFVPASGSPGRRTFSSNAMENANGNARLEWERPIGETRFLTLGVSADRNLYENDTTFQTLVGTPFAPDFFSTLKGEQSTLAAYGTYQFRVDRWTFLPGVRFEQYRRELRSSGGEDDEGALETFPSFHLRRNLAEGWDLDLSYSRRINRPQFNQLDPAVRFTEATRATSGNPDLQPTTTDAFEANIVYQDNQRTFNVTFYDRLREDIVSQFIELRPDGVQLTRPVNAGEGQQRGAQLIMRAPIGGGWRYSLSANLLSSEFDVLQGGALTRREELEYSGNAQIEYRDRNQSKPGADHLQFETQFQGPQHFLQGERDQFIIANFTWRRRLTEKFSGVFTVQDIFDSQSDLSEIRTDTFFERNESFGVGTRLRFTLTYQFGAPQARGGPQRDDMGGDAGPPVGGPEGPPMQ